VPDYTGTYDLGQPLNLAPVCARIAADESRLDDPALILQLNADVVRAQGEVRAAVAKAQAEAGALFADCKARARGWTADMAEGPMLALPHLPRRTPAA
jgi:hypothetical protein